MQFGKKTYKLVVPVEFSQLLIETEQRTKITKRMRKILNEILINTGYHDKNKEEQLERLKNAGAPKEEISMIRRAYSIFHKYSIEEQMENFNRLCTMMEGFEKDERTDAMEEFKDET